MVSDVVQRPQESSSASDAYELIAKGAGRVCLSRLVVLWVRRGELLEAVAAGGDGAPDCRWQEAAVSLDRVRPLLDAPAVLGVSRRVSPADWPEPGGGQQRDVLLVPLADDHERLRGLLTIEVPEGDWDAYLEARGAVGEFVRHVTQAVVLVLERERLTEQMRLADAARRVVRNALGERSLQRILSTCYPALVESFGADAIWIQTLDGEGPGAGTIYHSSGVDVDLPEDLKAVAFRTAHRLHERRRVSVTSVRRGPGEISADEAAVVYRVMESLGFAEVLCVPLSAGGLCLGIMVLGRTDPDVEWTEVERSAALDIGHDLGSALLLVRAFEREHVLVRRLQELDDYRTGMIATVAHELKNPLTAIRGHLEILDDGEGVAPTARPSLQAMGRGADRLTEIVDDLLLLSRVTNPDHPVDVEAIDLREVVDDVLALVAVAAEMRGTSITVDLPDHPVQVLGDRRELDRVLLNLVSNAIKYTPEGGAVRVGLADGDEVELWCADEGLGISEADQAQLFTEFFRSTNPEARSQPGTGLGLAICRRIVERHRGRIVVESKLGRGSTFRVLLPTP